MDDMALFDNDPYLSRVSMKELLKASQKVFKAMTAGETDSIQVPLMASKTISSADAEIVISSKILNDLLDQNFPFRTVLEIDQNKLLEINISGAEIKMESGNVVELVVTKATLQYEQMRFKIGIQSNAVALKLNLGIVAREEQFYLVVYGQFSSFDIKYLPSWLEKRLTELLRVKFLSPLLDYNVTELLTIDKEIDMGQGVFKLNMEPQEVAVSLNEKGISLQARFCNNTQAIQNET